MLFLDTDISVLHTDSMFSSIIDFSCREAHYWFNSNIHTRLKPFPFPWSSEIIDIRFFVDLCPESMACEFTDNMKSTLYHCCLNGSADISDKISCFCLCDTSSKSIFRNLNTSDMADIFRLTYDYGRRSICEISLVANTIVHFDDIP